MFSVYVNFAQCVGFGRYLGYLRNVQQKAFWPELPLFENAKPGKGEELTLELYFCKQFLLEKQIKCGDYYYHYSQYIILGTTHGHTHHIFTIS